MLEELTYVVFDLETTGLNAYEEEIIEIGAVKVKNREVIDKFDILIKPSKPIPENITSITNITNDMVKDATTCEDALKKFLEFAKDSVLVAHNANFDLSFIKASLLKYNFDKLNFDVLDTLGISRYLNPSEKYHNLTVLMERYDINWDENKHHRGDYDALGTSYVLYKMIEELKNKDINTLEQLYLIPKIVLNRKKDC